MFEFECNSGRTLLNVCMCACMYLVLRYVDILVVYVIVGYIVKLS